MYHCVKRTVSRGIDNNLKSGVRIYLHFLLFLKWVLAYPIHMICMWIKHFFLTITEISMMTSLVKLTYLCISQEIRLQDLPFYHPQHVGCFFFFFFFFYHCSHCFMVTKWLTHFLNLIFIFFIGCSWFMGFPVGLDGKEFACNAGNLALFPGLGRSHWRRAW